MSTGPVTASLRAWSAGDPDARERLVPLLYDELRRLAARHLEGERAGHTLQATALVHEVYLRLERVEPVHWDGRAQFFGLASRLMRRILVDHARRRTAHKRGGGGSRVATAAVEAQAPGHDGLERLVALDEALGELAALDPMKARVVELRFFGGLTAEETAEVLGCSRNTVVRHWRLAKALLRESLEHPGVPESAPANPRVAEKVAVPFLATRKGDSDVEWS